MEEVVEYGDKSIEIEVKETGFLRRGLGLMFRTKSTRNLLFDFSKDTLTPLTALFVFFPFLVLWLDNNNKVIDTRLVRPFEVHINTKKEFRKIIEIPINGKNGDILEFFDDKFKNI
tara:strand:+ start:1433 stop:1780 length:348 start_codon:yes stop_codon:yes gene_type:complete